MSIPKDLHFSRPWRIHELTRDYELQDVWALPTPGGPDDLDRLVLQFAGVRGGQRLSSVVMKLMALRWKLGALVGWDKPEFGVGAGARSLRGRLPADLRDSPGPDMGRFLFSSVYQTHDEWVGEYADRLLHAIMHVGWVKDDAGDGYHAQMAVLVKSFGWGGKAYMAGIRPFRHILVYPSMLRSVERAWQRQSAG